MDIYWYMVKWQIYSLYGRLGFLILYCGEQGLHNVPVLIYTFYDCKDRWTKRGGELGNFQISKTK